jgi:hypothetical protein
MLPNQTPNEA